jgi:hypothetical protein
MAKFNARINRFNNGFYRIILSIYLWPQWVLYQIRRSKESYIPAFLKCKNKKPFYHLLLDIFRLWLRFRCIPFHYFRYGLYRRGFAFVRVCKYYPETLFFHKILPAVNRNYSILDDKNLFESIISSSSIRYPRTLLKIRNGCLYDSDNYSVENADQLQIVLGQSIGDSVIVKPADYSSGGKSIFSIFRNAHGWIDSESNPVTYEWVSKLTQRDWIFQEALENSKEIAAIHNHCLNSFRVMTIFKRGCKPQAIYVSLKLGTSSTSATDNAHTGGIYVGVDNITGCLGDRGFDEDLNEYFCHPLSLVKFEGNKIERIHSVIDCAERAALLFPDLMIVGWDVALCEDGAYLIEGNSSPGLTVIQRPHDGLDKLIGELYN